MAVTCSELFVQGKVRYKADGCMDVWTDGNLAGAQPVVLHTTSFAVERVKAGLGSNGPQSQDIRFTQCLNMKHNSRRSVVAVYVTVNVFIHENSGCLFSPASSSLGSATNYEWKHKLSKTESPIQLLSCLYMSQLLNTYCSQQILPVLPFSFQRNSRFW